MGEIADMMLEGTLCQTCGEYMDHEGSNEGYPVSCPGCIAVGDAPKPALSATELKERERIGKERRRDKNRRKRQRQKANKRKRLEEAARQVNGA